MTDSLTLAVWMITYNHEAYIEQAVESVMMQETDFRYKLFIGEDCSTDRTREKCVALKNKYPDMIELILHENNVGAAENGMIIYEKCFNSGAKYIAMLEGDDYWTGVTKLQKQVDFLDHNPDFSLCFHDIQLNRNGNIEASKSVYSKDVFDIYDYANEGFIQTSSIVYRNFGFENFPFHLKQFYAGDGILISTLAKLGLLKYIPETLSVYRIHETGIWSMQNQAYLNKKKIADLRLTLNLETDNRLREIFKSKLFHEYRKIWNSEKNYRYLLSSFRINPILTIKIYVKKYFNKP